MEKNDAEGILQISSDVGLVNGDRLWKGNDLYFVPAAGWTAGIRYTLSLLGTLRSKDGRELRLEKFVSFYARNKNAPPFLVWYSPEDGASVGTGGVVMEFCFSRPMERLSVESALTVEGMGTKSFEWLADDTVLKVIPDKALASWIPCRWNLKDTAKSRDGVPLPKSYSGQFTTDQDRILPRVERIFPVLNAGGCWYPTGAGIETGLAAGQGIAVEFNKIMGETVLRSLRFEPSLTGRTELLSEKSIVYILTRDPEPETTYTITVSGDTRDSEGLKIGADFRINFIPDIPYLTILSFRADGGPVMENISAANNISQVPVSPTAGELSFTIRFSMPFGTEEKQNTALKIFLSSFFPGTIPPVALKSIQWISDDRLRMEWEGLSAGSESENHYYKLTIPGGKSGISSGEGMYMKEDKTIILEAVK
jgi:hypothetical protein